MIINKSRLKDHYLFRMSINAIILSIFTLIQLFSIISQSLAFTCPSYSIIPSSIYVNSYDNFVCAIQSSISTIYINTTIILINEVAIIDKKSSISIIGTGSNPSLATITSRAFNVTNSYELIISNLKITGNANIIGHSYGGIIYTYASALDLRNVSVIGGFSTCGGGIRAEYSNITISQSIFNNNTCNGVIDLFDINSCNGGGAISVYSGQQTMIIESQFGYNTAYTGGSIEQQFGDYFYIQDSKFYHNYAINSNGGSIRVAEVKKVVIISSIFEHNFAQKSGGAILLSNLTNSGIVSTSTFYNNSASTFGGVIDSFGSDLGIRTCHFKSNFAGEAGMLKIDDLTIIDFYWCLLLIFYRWCISIC